MNNTNSLILVSHIPQPLTYCPPPAFEASAAFRLSDLDGSEKVLCEEVRLLMIDDAKRSRAKRVSQVEQRQVRLALGAKLYHLKQSICKPGRNGGWSGFLVAAEIPKRTADRYIEVYRCAMEGKVNLATGQIPASPEELAKELERLSRRLRKMLHSEDQVKWFLERLAIRLLT